MANEINASTLNTLHNLNFYLDTLRRIRDAIVFRRFESFRLAFHQSLSRQLPRIMMFSRRWSRVRHGHECRGRQPSGADRPVHPDPGDFLFHHPAPEQRKQQKVQEFLENLKENDRVITTSGIYGQITRINGDKRAAAGRRQGADRRVEGGDRRLSGSAAGRRDREPVKRGRDCPDRSTCRTFAGRSSPSSPSS